MKKLITILLIIGNVVLNNSCKKDYPNDIPKWLKEKIKDLEKETKRYKDCRNGICRNIDEYSDGTNTIYWFQGSETPIGYSIYDYDGNAQCYFATNVIYITGTPTATTICGSIGKIDALRNYKTKRRIWEERH